MIAVEGFGLIKACYWSIACSRCVGVLTRFILVLGKWLDALLMVLLSLCTERGEPRGSQASKSSAPPKILPIEMPTISLDELKRLTSNFRTKALVGEGSYGQVFSATLRSWKERSTGGYTWPCSQLEPKSQPFKSLLTC
ncbi:hypothetical protein IFM89_020890 [Coptis chinensis]|uniref:Uncharacterized protein n=1 Tax=Coptis chinensis TaxID=261450 RepID=A0A835HXD5_9MAGN|nr:hypothetical protein IFM89_020890 [Coptis chinensis]